MLTVEGKPEYDPATAMDPAEAPQSA